MADGKRNRSKDRDRKSKSPEPRHYQANISPKQTSKTGTYKFPEDISLNPLGPLIKEPDPHEAAPESSSPHKNRSSPVDTLIRIEDDILKPENTTPPEKRSNGKSPVKQADPAAVQDKRKWSPRCSTRSSMKESGLSPHTEGYLDIRRKSDGPPAHRSKSSGRKTTTPEFGNFLSIGLDTDLNSRQRRKSSPAIHLLEERERSPEQSVAQSLNRLAIGTLNASSSDVSGNLIRSGHKDIGGLFSDSEDGNLKLNLLNCPNSSTVQCDCGHINCPCCNLLMNLEVTDPSILI